jgi:hypothetical protein
VECVGRFGVGRSEVLRSFDCGRVHGAVAIEARATGRAFLLEYDSILFFYIYYIYYTGYYSALEGIISQVEGVQGEKGTLY